MPETFACLTKSGDGGKSRSSWSTDSMVAEAILDPPLAGTVSLPAPARPRQPDLGKKKARRRRLLRAVVFPEREEGERLFLASLARGLVASFFRLAFARLRRGILRRVLLAAAAAHSVAVLVLVGCHVLAPVFVDAVVGAGAHRAPGLRPAVGLSLNDHAFLDARVRRLSEGHGGEHGHEAEHEIVELAHCVCSLMK